MPTVDVPSSAPRSSHSFLHGSSEHYPPHYSDSTRNVFCTSHSKPWWPLQNEVQIFAVSGSIAFLSIRQCPIPSFDFPSYILTFMFSLEFFLLVALWSLQFKTKQTALVTGANRGIGKEVSRQLAAKGYQVFLGSRDAERGQATVDELRAAGHADVHLLVLDVTSDDSVAQAAADLATKVSALDVLVNNAGVAAAGFTAPVDESIAQIKSSYEINVFGVVRATQGFLPLLKKSKHGRIVNVSSGLGSTTLDSDKSYEHYNLVFLGYNSSKAALNNITVTYAKALAEFGIKVNASDPGYTATDMNGHQGTQTVEIGSQSTVYLATLPEDGPTGTFYRKDGVIPW